MAVNEKGFYFSEIQKINEEGELKAAPFEFSDLPDGFYRVKTARGKIFKPDKTLEAEEHVQYFLIETNDTDLTSGVFTTLNGNTVEVTGRKIYINTPAERVMPYSYSIVNRGNDKDKRLSVLDELRNYRADLTQAAKQMQEEAKTILKAFDQKEGRK